MSDDKIRSITKLYTGMAICMEQGVDCLHMVQLMPILYLFTI